MDNQITFYELYTNIKLFDYGINETMPNVSIAIRNTENEAKDFALEVIRTKFQDNTIVLDWKEKFGQMVAMDRSDIKFAIQERNIPSTSSKIKHHLVIWQKENIPT